MFEPYFDQYLPSVTFNDGKCVFVPLHPPTGSGRSSGRDWTIREEELRFAHNLINNSTFFSYYFSNLELPLRRALK
jgi:hypothetical protein